MSQLLYIASSFPTVVWTVILGVALIYWVFVILGALDIDLFGDADIDGVSEGGADGVAGGAGEGADAADAADTGTGGGAGILAALGLRRVPLTVSVSFVVLFSWITCLLVLFYAGDWLGALPRWLAGTLLLVASFLLAVPLASLASRPLAPLFQVHGAKRAADYIGSMCTVTTGRVDAKFGQALIEDGGDLLRISVCCDHENNLARHDKALIIDYDKERAAYLIEPMEAVMGKRAGTGEDAQPT
jgi:hypothetical protein